MDLRSALIKYGYDEDETDKTALVYMPKNGKQVTYSWRAYLYQASLFARVLQSYGIGAGDFVAVVSLNVPESFIALLGVILTGAVPVPINVMLLKDDECLELNQIIANCCSKLLIYSEGITRKIKPALKGRCSRDIEDIIMEGNLLGKAGNIFKEFIERSTQANELFLMPYTSGTGGSPKGVMLCEKNIADRVEAVADRLGIDEHERVLSYLPLGHISELIATFFGQLYLGYQVYFTEYAKDVLGDRAEFRKMFPAILRCAKPTLFIGVPAIWKSFCEKIESSAAFRYVSMLSKRLAVFLLRRHMGLNKTRFLISAASKLDDHDQRYLSAALGSAIDDIYGQTETAGPLIINGEIIGNVGIVFDRAVREIKVIGNCVMLGYYGYGREGVFEKVFIPGPGINTAEVYKTGDAGQCSSRVWLYGKICPAPLVPSTAYVGRLFGELGDANGRVTFSGRIKDAFKLANGEYVSEHMIGELEGSIMHLEPTKIKAVIVCGAGKKNPVAMIFVPFADVHDYKLRQQLKKGMPQIGEGMYKIKDFVLLDSAELVLGPTMKIKRDDVINKYNNVISAMP